MCTNVSNLFYFGMTLYMFRTVSPSIIRSSRLYVQQQAYVKQIRLCACRQQYLFDICLLLYVQSWTPDDGRKDRPKHVECHSKRNKIIWYIGASSWFFHRKRLKLHKPVIGCLWNVLATWRIFMGRDSSIGISTCYGLDGPGMESRWGDQPGSHIMGTGSFPGVKLPGRGADHPPHPAQRLKKEYSSTSVPSLVLSGLF